MFLVDYAELVLAFFVLGAGLVALRSRTSSGSGAESPNIRNQAEGRVAANDISSGVDAEAMRSPRARAPLQECVEPSQLEGGLGPDVQ